MNDELDPNKLPQPIAQTGMTRAGAAGTGLGLFIISVFFGVITYGVGFLIGLAVAIASLFYSGYRYIFVGFILSTLITVGVLFLILTIACSNMRM